MRVSQRPTPFKVSFLLYPVCHAAVAFADSSSSLSLLAGVQQSPPLHMQGPSVHMSQPPMARGPMPVMGFHPNMGMPGPMPMGMPHMYGEGRV